MQQFMAGAAAVHWYVGDSPTGFINYVNYIHTLDNRPNWITELCPADWSGNRGVTVAEDTSVTRTVIPQLNAASFLQRYSWFSAGTTDADLGQGALYHVDRSLTTLGRLYAGM